MPCSRSPRGCYPSMHYRWYPSMPCSRSPRGCYPSMHCRWYTSMPCSRSPGGAIPACIAGGIPACLAAGLPGGCYPNMHCPLVSQHALQQVSGGVSQHALQVSRGKFRGIWPGVGVSPGPHPRGKLRGIWSRPTPKGEVEGDLTRGYLLQRVPALGGVCCRGMPAPVGLPALGGCGDPPWWLLLRAVHILLECILFPKCFRWNQWHCWILLPFKDNSAVP